MEQTSTWTALVHTMTLCGPPSFFMLIGSLAVFCQQPSHTFVSMMQHLGAGIVLSAVSTELLPAMSAQSSSHGYEYTAATLIGFFLGVAVMVGVAAMSSDEPDHPHHHHIMGSDGKRYECEEEAACLLNAVQAGGEGGSRRSSAAIDVQEGGGRGGDSSKAWSTKGASPTSTVRSFNSSTVRSLNRRNGALRRQAKDPQASQRLFARRRSLMETYRQQAASVENSPSVGLGYASSSPTRPYRRQGSSRSSHGEGGTLSEGPYTPPRSRMGGGRGSSNRRALSPPPIKTSGSSVASRRPPKKTSSSASATESSALLGGDAWTPTVPGYSSQSSLSPGRAHKNDYYDYHDENYYSPRRPPRDVGLVDDADDESSRQRRRSSEQAEEEEEEEDDDDQGDEEEGVSNKEEDEEETDGGGGIGSSQEGGTRKESRDGGVEEYTSSPFDKRRGSSNASNKLVGMELLVTADNNQQTTTTTTAGGFAKVPWTLVLAVFVDSFMDGLLIGLSAVAGKSAGFVMSVALTIEMTFLGLTFSAGITKVRPSLRNALVTGGPILLLLGGLVGALAAHALSTNPILQVGLIAFGVAALLYLITEELLVEAHEEGGPHVWYVDMMFFVGFILSVLLEQAVQDREMDAAAAAAGIVDIGGGGGGGGGQ